MFPEVSNAQHTLCQNGPWQTSVFDMVFSAITCFPFIAPLNMYRNHSVLNYFVLISTLIYFSGAAVSGCSSEYVILQCFRDDRNTPWDICISEGRENEVSASFKVCSMYVVCVVLLLYDIDNWDLLCYIMIVSAVHAWQCSVHAALSNRQYHIPIAEGTSLPAPR